MQSTLTPDQLKLISSGQAPASLFGVTIQDGKVEPMNPATLQRATSASTIGAAIELDQLKSGSLADEWVKLLQPSKDGVDENSKDFTVVAKELAASLSSKEETVDQGYINRKLNEVMQETNSTPAQAALLIKQSIKGADRELTAWNPLNWVPSAFGSVNRWIDGTPRLSNGFQIDSDKLESNIEEVKSGRLLNSAVNQSNKQQNVGDLLAAKTAADMAQRNYIELKMRSEDPNSRPVSAIELAEAEKQWLNSQQYLKSLNQSFSGSGNREIIDDFFNTERLSDSEKERLKILRENELASANRR